MIKIEKVLHKQTELMIIGANWTKAEARPFFVNELAEMYKNFVFVVVNSYPNVLPVLEGSQRTLFGIILIQQAQAYSYQYILFLIAFLVVAAINCMGLAAGAVMLNSRMAKFYSGYSLLKPYEIDLQWDFLEKKMKSYEVAITNEVIFLTDFISANWNMAGRLNPTTIDSAKQIEKGGRKNASISSQMAMTRIKRFKRDRVQTSSIYLQGVNLSYALLILVLVLLSQTFNRMSSKIISYQQYFMNTNKYITDVSKSLHTYILYTNFANYIRMDGSMVSNDIYSYAVDNFINFFSQSRIEHLALLEDRYNEIQSYLNSDMCQHLSDPNEIRRAKVVSICKESQELLGFSGLNSFLLIQKEYLLKVKSSFNARLSPTDFERSKTTFISFDVTDYMDTTFARIRYINYIGLETLSTIIREIALSRIQAINEEIANLLTSFQIIFSTFLYLYAIFSIYFGVHMLRQDNTLATETFKIISSWVLTTNPYLLNLLKTLLQYR